MKYLQKYKIQRTLTLIVFVVSASASLISLYYGYYGDLINNLSSGDLLNSANALAPCDLCWYQRAMMYPIAVVSLISLIIRDKKAVIYTTALSGIGAVIAVYHIYVQQAAANPFLPCNSESPCNEIQIEYLGFLTIPVMSLIAFGIILIIGFLYLSQNKGSVGVKTLSDKKSKS